MEILKVNTQRALSPTNINLADFVINTYKGCQFGCKYCYARSNKNIVKIKKEWGEYVFIKDNFITVLENEINSTKSITRVLLGSTTEPFQPIEKVANTSRDVLYLLKKYNIPVTILTKSILIEDYLTLLQYSEHNLIYFTYNTEKVRELFEKRTASQNTRLKTLTNIKENNIPLIVYVSPFFPIISDYKIIMNDLKDIATELCFENYNMKMGNKSEIFSLLSPDLQQKYTSIYDNKKNYNKFWNDLKNEIYNYSEEFNYKINCNFYDLDIYYNR